MTEINPFEPPEQPTEIVEAEVIEKQPRPRVATLLAFLLLLIGCVLALGTVVALDQNSRVGANQPPMLILFVALYPVTALGGGMGMLLAKMPWNQINDSPGCSTK